MESVPAVMGREALRLWSPKLPAHLLHAILCVKMQHQMILTKLQHVTRGMRTGWTGLSARSPQQTEFGAKL